MPDPAKLDMIKYLMTCSLFPGAILFNHEE
jgi:hypothetical protein